jgi:glycosyltransferase involved in cell wall biosynthesis
MPPSAILISFVLPAYNEAGLLPFSIQSIREAFQSCPEGLYEILVCDNNSTDNTADVARSLGAQVVFEPHNQIAKARNTGACHASGQWLCFVDSDTRIPPLLGRRLLETIRQADTGGGGARVRFDLEKQPFFASLVLHTWNAVSVLFHLAAGSFLFCRREAWEQTGGFDEDFYAAEELLFSQALKKWCRENNLRFKIISDSSVLTSARKLQWHSGVKLFLVMLSLLRPGSLTKRETCSFWYQRPND